MSIATVIYHKNDYDGLMSGAIMEYGLTVGSFRPTMIGWDYGDPVPEVDQDVDLFLVDISIKELMGHPHLTWIDHHKTAIEQWDKPEIPGFRLDGVAACRLCWQWLKQEFPDKDAFVDREVDEPRLVRLLGEYDIWDERDPAARLLQLGLQGAGFGLFELYNLLLSGSINEWTERLVNDGEPIQGYLSATTRRKVNEQSYQLNWEGLRFAVLNQNSGNSLSFEGYARMEEVDALMIWRWDQAKGSVVVGMYHAPHRKDLDLSEIAKRHGGGGHWGACGFQLTATQASVIFMGCDAQ